MKTLNIAKVSTAKQAGFTIIELIVVILLLGILSATALPRFIDVTDQAHDAVVEGAIGGLATGVALFRAQWVANGEPAPGVVVTGFGAGNLVANAAGYPISATATDTVIDSADDCEVVWINVLQGGAPTISTVDGGTADPLVGTNVTGSLGDFQILYNDAGDPQECFYAYTGQYTTVALATAASDVVPMIHYNALTGIVTQSTVTDANLLAL